MRDNKQGNNLSVQQAIKNSSYSIILLTAGEPAMNAGLLLPYCLERAHAHALLHCCLCTDAFPLAGEGTSKKN